MRRLQTLFLLFCIPILFSCVSTKKFVYLDNIGDAEIDMAVDNLEPVIQKNDLLSISVSSPNPAATQIFNPSTANSNLPAGGYLVNQQGYIEFPMLGLVKAADLTKKQLKENITKTILQNQLLLDPVVTIRYLNFRVTVLGEVAKPSVITVADEKVSILEALGLAGDLTIYAKRDNVLIIREEGGKRITKRVDLTSRNLLMSPYYYLKSNDVIYVEPSQAKASSASLTRQLLPIIFSTISVLTLIIFRFSRIQ
jgi:polysaccharide export outer membrane protein